jgi:small subunit ribosomal protein S6
MKPTKRNYRATFILDNRGKEDSIEQIIEGVKKDIVAVQGEVTAVDNIGKKDFVRVTDKKLTGATYVHVSFSAPAEAPAQLIERLRLNNSVYRTFVQSA